MNFKLTPEQSPCKGLTFRGYSTMFKSGGHIGYHQGIKLLKRKSCTCEKCNSMLDVVHDAISDKYLIIPEIEHGELYSVRICNESIDWESGICDSYDVEVFKL